MKAYLAAEGFEKELQEELPKIERQYGRLFVTKAAPAQTPAWAQNIWLNPELHRFSSAAQAVRLLRERGRQWSYLPGCASRISYEIEKQIPGPKLKPLHFLGRLPQASLGAWTLLEPDLLLLSSKTSSPFAHGEMEFSEDRRPPNRAYLKLWELFTVHGFLPEANARCVDLGASPGGWTWVLQSLGCDVVAVDKASLAPTVRGLKRVKCLRQDAFALKPEEIGPVDWLFSDIICYPPRLLELVTEWRESGLVKNFVCTIKFQGRTDFKTLKQFQSIPGSQILHLCHNKHELTWILQDR